VAVVRLRLVPHEPGPLTVRFGLRAWPLPSRRAFAKLERYEPQWTQDSVWYPGQMVTTASDATSITARAAGGTTRLAEVQRVSSDTTGDTITYTKTVAVATSLETTQPLARARAVVRAAAARGYDVLLAEHTAAWHQLWQTDVVIDGDPELQRVVHAMLFYLLASVREGSSESIPPMGLSSDGYYGHVFWDADTWMFPALVALHPALARSMVDFRFRALAAALRNAHANGLRGAMYPWESDEIGNEATPAFAGQNARWENHVTADVALAQWQYFLASGDSAWLARHGYPVIAATADFWVSRATRDAAGHYSIPHVVSVDEGMIGVGNDTYTNAAARKNLELAGLAARRLGRVPDPRWARVAAGLVMPYDSAGQYHPTYEGAPDSTRGSVVPLLAYPLALPMSDAAKRNDLDAAVARLKTEGGGAMMTVTLYAVVAGELGERALVDTLMSFSYREHLRPPFAVLAETAHNQAVNFLTGAGAFLQQIVYGWAGVRLGDDGLHVAFPPALPSSVRRLTLTNVPVRGRRYDIIVEGDSTRLLLR
jgi:trehalose/maltose hydrolase-like predicted phosphorylase